MISIHAPLTGSDYCLCFLLVIYSLFQSTLPSQGATKIVEDVTFSSDISIHAPLTGSDGGGNTWLEKRTRFQSTLPSQGATPYMEAGLVMQMISIHAPLTGSDPPVCAIWERLLISIHAPLTGSDSGGHNGHYGRVDFNPRSPHRERQICASVFTPEVVISIHAPLTGSDSKYTHKIPL